jgi:DNA-binding winged helix-turn-helix (wHTH) protein
MMSGQMRLSFGDFCLDLDQRRLFARDREIRLAPKGFELLKLLIESRPKALAKDELFRNLWPDTFVTENNLATLITDLRAALADEPHHSRFIRTVYGYGYAFCAAATEERSGAAREARPSAWTLICHHREIALAAGQNILGRVGADVVVFDSPTVSRHHARLSIAGEQAVIEDLGSKNGTWVGQTPVRGPVAVKDGDELRLGSVVATVRFWPRSLTTETVERAVDAAPIQTQVTTRRRGQRP